MKFHFTANCIFDSDDLTGAFIDLSIHFTRLSQDIKSDLIKNGHGYMDLKKFEEKLDKKE